MTVRFSKALEPFLVPIDSIQPHPDNPNHGDDDAVMESILSNGLLTLFTADANTGYMVAVHTRQRVLKKLGATHIPLIWEDEWDETGAKRYLIGDNASAAKAEMDHDALMEILKELHDESPTGLTGTAITETEYEAMLMEGANEEPPEGVGFGDGVAALGMYQIILDFPDNEDERDAIFAELIERYDNVRKANL